jgi:predicted TPR repeat methyltransferase
MSKKVYEVFAAQNAEELAQRYDEWAASYEDDMDDHGGPREAVEALAAFAGPDALVLDAGCGTGLVGELLAARGYRNLEGLDLSEGMLAKAAAKGCYTALHQGALGGAPLDLPAHRYDAIVCVGVFTRAHAPATSLHELVRLVKPGGYIVFTLRPEFYAASDFKTTMADLTAAGSWQLVETGEQFDARYKEFPGINMQVWVYRAN